MRRYPTIAAMLEGTADIIVIGGGLVGAAAAYGLAGKGLDVLMLDEGDDAFRAARGNFGLVWVQTKGFGLQRYQEWSQESADRYSGFAEELAGVTGIDIHHERPGGAILCLGDGEWEAQRRLNDAMAEQGGGYHARMVERAELERMAPGVRFGQEVVGASFSEKDGHCGPLFLLRALHAGFRAKGGRYRPGARVLSIQRGFRVETEAGLFEAPKLLLAAGNGIPPLAPQVGLHVPTVPERGQVLVTERVERFPADADGQYPPDGGRHRHGGRDAGERRFRYRHDARGGARAGPARHPGAAGAGTAEAGAELGGAQGHPAGPLPDLRRVQEPSRRLRRDHAQRRHARCRSCGPLARLDRRRKGAGRVRGLQRAEVRCSGGCLSARLRS